MILRCVVLSTYCFGKDTHELGELMCEHGQHGSERAKACCEEDEEGKLFLWVHRHLVECCSDSQKNESRSLPVQIKKTKHEGLNRERMINYTNKLGAIE